MLLERVNKKVIIAVAVLSFSCAAAAAYTAIKDERTTDKLIISEPANVGFGAETRWTKGSLCELPTRTPRDAQNHLNMVQQPSPAT